MKRANDIQGPTPSGAPNRPAPACLGLADMATLLLVRHGRTGANASGVLSGRSAGVDLDEAGRQQARALGERVARLRLATVVSSPLERCVQTAAAVATAASPVELDDRLTECDYGTWTGRSLTDLRREKLWRVVQDHPSGAVFPAGEPLRAMQSRAVEAVRDHDSRVEAVAGPDAVWMAVTHGDVIKAIVADALGLHLDFFQRLVADPCSVNVIVYTRTRPFVARLNDTGGDLSMLRPKRRRRRARSGDAVVGGGGGQVAR